MYKVNAEGGKYTFINDNGIVSILRYEEQWREETGDKALLCLLHQVESLEVERNYWKEQYSLLQDKIN